MSLSPAQIIEYIASEDALVYNTGAIVLLNSSCAIETQLELPVAASAFLFWDYCITLEQEVVFIWLHCKRDVLNMPTGQADLEVHCA
jgi:hypothetical protein